MLFRSGGYYLQSAERWQQLSSPEAKGIQYVVQLSGLAAALTVSCGGLALLVPRVLQSSRLERLQSLPIVGEALVRTREIVELYRRQPGVLVLGLLLSVCSTLLFAVSIYLLAVFYGGNHPTLADHCIIAPISLVANAVPLPGGLGGMETMLDFLYRAFSPSRGGPPKGVPVAFAFRFVFLLMAGFGAVAWFAIGKQERQSLQSGELS